VAPNDLQIETRPRECHLQGEDELCVSAFGVGKLVTLNLELTYKVSKEVGGYQISSTVWELSLDCEAKTVSARDLKFLDMNGIEAPFGDDVIKTASEGIESEYGLLLDRC
jgi:hypothetical protein